MEIDIAILGALKKEFCVLYFILEVVQNRLYYLWPEMVYFAFY